MILANRIGSIAIGTPPADGAGKWLQRKVVNFYIGSGIQGFPVKGKRSEIFRGFGGTGSSDEAPEDRLGWGTERYYFAHPIGMFGCQGFDICQWLRTRQ